MADLMTIVYILLATILLWIMLFFSTKFIVTKHFAKDKKIALLIAALLIVIVVALITGLIGSVLNAIGDAVASIRNAIDDGGRNYMGGLVPIISFLLIMLILHFFVGIDWEKTTWIALIAIFLLYLLFCLIPELDFVNI